MEDRQLICQEYQYNRNYKGYRLLTVLLLYVSVGEKKIKQSTNQTKNPNQANKQTPQTKNKSPRAPKQKKPQEPDSTMYHFLQSPAVRLVYKTFHQSKQNLYSYHNTRKHFLVSSHCGCCLSIAINTC